MVFTDPPYNVDYNGKAGKIIGDKMSPADFDDFLDKTFSCLAHVLSPGGAVYVAHADSGPIGVSFRRAFLQAGLHLAACLIWRKNHFALSRSDYQWMHEPILYGWKDGAPHRWFGGRKKKTVIGAVDDHVKVLSGCECHVHVGDDVVVITGDNLAVSTYMTTVITEDKPLKNGEHPTMKPVALVERFVKNSSRPGEVVFDPFGGSGSTLIACEKTGRKCRTMDIDPKFCDVMVTRWQEYAGEEAVLFDDGRTFAEIKEARRA